MKLPEMQYSSGGQKKTISRFGGLNRRIEAAEGELISSSNLSAAAYPALCPREARAEYGSWSSPTDAFEWNGHVVVIDGGNALYDGKIIGNVTPGQKQFAVVNTKLIIWPDKVYIDLDDNSFNRMDESVTAPGADVSVYTANSITLGVENVAATKSEEFTTINVINYGSDGTMYRNNSYAYAFTYTGLKWENGAWIETGGSQINISAEWKGKYIKLRASDVDGLYNLNTHEYSNFSFSGTTWTTEIKEYSTDMDGTCALVTDVKMNFEGSASETIYTWTVEFQVVDATEDSPSLSGRFSAGDWVSFEGLPGTTPGQEFRISAIDDDTRTLSFPEGSFTILGQYYYRLTEAQDEEWNLLTGVMPSYNLIYGVKLPPLPAGSVLYCDTQPSNTSTVTAWNVETGEITEKTSETLGSSSVPHESFTFTQGTGIVNWPLTVNRKTPDMDFICSHNNRLYGVSNDVSGLTDETTAEKKYKSRVIYVSELGEPMRFTTFEGVDTDSYQAAEASNGDFTACCSYGDYVLFFKEHKVVKFYGYYPSQMGYTYDDIEGVKAGCHRSLVIVNETLYYMGRSGLCAYTGTVPGIVSYKLDREYEDVICASDGWKILMSGKSGNASELLSYYPELGIWLREDDTTATALTQTAEGILIVAGRRIYKDRDGAAKVEWSAELHPFTEGTFKRKKWKYVRLRAEFEAGASLRLLVKIGDGEHEKWLEAEKTGWQTITVPLPLMRTDRMSIRLEGKGKCIVRDIEREYQMGSEL